MASRDEILELLIQLADTYGEIQAKPAGYYLALDDIDAGLLDAVHAEAVKTLKWWPKPSELRDIARQLQAGADETERIHRQYFRMCQLFGDYAAGRRDDDRTWNTVSEYFGIADRAAKASASARAA